MQTIGKQVGKFTLRGLGCALLMIVGLAMLSPRTSAQTNANNTIVNQTHPLAALSADGTGSSTKGGWGGSSTPTGETFVVDSHGNAIVGTNWAESLLAVNTSTGAVTVLVSGDNNVGPVALDSAGNLYFGNTYGSNIYKIPWTGSGYAAVNGASLPTTVCTGAANTTTDTAPCQFALNLQDATGYYGVAAMAVDPSGNFWIATNQWPGEAANGAPINNSLLMCNATCQTGTQYDDAPVSVYTDSTGSDELGEFAIDPWGNVFFTQASFSSSLPTTSGLYEISPNGSGGFFAPTPVVSYTNTASYSNSLGGVAIDPTSGTVYFTTNADGIFAIPNTESGGPDTSSIYTVSLVGGKGIAEDSSGNLYQIAYGSAFFSGGSDMVEQILVNNVITPITGQQQTMDVPVTVIDNGAAVCTGGTPSTLNFVMSGANASQFTASVNAPTAPATTSCSSQGIGGSSPVPLGVSFPVTVAYTPTATGTSTATMASTDTVTNATGSATLTGLAEKQQSISFTTSLTWTYSSGLTIALQASGGRSGNPVTFTLVSGPATLDGTVANQLDVSAPGTIVVEANQAGNATYAPAPTLTKDIVVSPIPQSISWAPAPPRNVTTASGPITLVATGGASTNPVVFTLDAASTGQTSSTAATAGTLSGTNNDTLTLSGTAGVLVIDANQAGNTDYAAAPQVQATIVVTAALLPTGPPVILSQTTYLGELTGGGATAASNPNGGTMAIDPNGNAIIGTTYGSGVLSFNINNTNAGDQTALDTGDGGNPGAIAIDSNGNLFVGETYGGAPYILKIPYVSGAYTPLTSANFPARTVACTGPTSDTSACWMTNVTAGTVYPVVSMTFDSSGDLFYGIENDSSGAGTSGITNPDSIWECDANCLYGGGDSPVMLYQEPAAGTTTLSPTTSVQLTLGSISVDSAGNVFYTDAAIDASSLIHYSSLYELPTSTGAGYGGATTGYAASSTTLVTNIPSSPGQYVGEIDAVAIDSTTGNVYFSDQGATYAFMDNGSPLDPQTVNATMWTVSAQGGKFIAVAPGGATIYQSDYEGAVSKDSMFYTTVGSVTVPGTVIDGQTAMVPGTAVIGSSTTPVTQMYTVLNDGNCTNPETVTYLDSSDDTVFTAALNAPVAPATTTCAGTFTDGSWFPTTLTFAPVAPANGAVSETLTATDSASNTGAATVTGTAQNLIPQTITAFAGITSPVTYGSGPYTLSATGGASGNAVVFTIDSSSTSGVATVSGTNGTTLTITGVGTLVIDINQAGNSTYQAAPQVQETITVNQATQAISFTSPSSATSSVVYGASAITLAATGGGSGNAVTFTLDASSTAGAGSLSGSTLTFTGVGTIVVDANQAGNANYSAAPQVQVSITVTQATQTITLTPSANSAIYPATISLTATGGASGSPVVLAITSGSSIATLSGNVLTPTGTAFGEVTVQATQAGTTDYSAAATQTATVTFNPIGTVATPAFTPASGSTLYTNGQPTNQVTITDGTANSVISYSLDDAAPANYTGPITLALGSHTITASATETGYLASTQASATYTVSNLPPNFTVSVSPGAVDLTPGSSAIVDITITPNASFLGTVTFSCSGAPSGVTCAFSPSSVTANGVNNVTTVLTITDAATTSANRRGPNPFIPGGATFALALCFLGFRKRRSLVLGLVLLAGIFGLTQLTGCGSNAGNSSTGSTTSSMTVTATSAYNGTTITQTLPITITIRK